MQQDRRQEIVSIAILRLSLSCGLCSSVFDRPESAINCGNKNQGADFKRFLPSKHRFRHWNVR